MQLKTWLIFTLCLSCLEFCSVIKIHGVYTWRFYFSGGKRQGRKATETHHSVQLLMCSIRQFVFSSVRLMEAVLRQGNKGSLLAGQAKASHLGGTAGYPQRCRPCCPTAPQLPLSPNICRQRDKEELKRHWRGVSVFWSSVVTFWSFPLEILLEDGTVLCHFKLFTG